MAQWDNYSTKTSPVDSDTMMIKDNAATGKPNKRVLFSGLWDWIVSKLANAVISSLTTNPKTVTGGMNALQAAVATLNSNLYNANLGTVINNNDDLDTYTKPGTYYCNSASKAATLAHCPVNNSGFKLLVIRTGYENANLIQIIEVPIGINDGGSTYRRMGNPSAWGNWAKSPTRYDIDTLNSRSSSAIQLEEGLSALSAIVYKKGQYVTLKLEMNNVSPSQRGWFTFGTVPEGYRPYVPINCVAIDNNANAISEIPLQLRISDSGVIQFYCFDASKSYKPLIAVTYLQDY